MTARGIVPSFTMAALIALLLIASAPAQEPANPQAVFERLLLRDARTAPAIKTMLRRGSGFVDPTVTFTELTRDRRSDAVVIVNSGGITGTVGVYVFTSATRNGGNGTLRASLRLQSLRRASVTVGGGRIVITDTAYAAGNELCCPAEVVDMTYAWDRAAGIFKRTATARRPGPKG